MLQNTFGITQKNHAKKKFMSSLIYKTWKMWPQTLICKIFLIWSSTYIYNRLSNANINYLKSKSGGKCVTHVNFSHMQRFLSQMSITYNTVNVLLTPCVSRIVVHFCLIIFSTLPIHFEMWQPLVHLFWKESCSFYV